MRTSKERKYQVHFMYFDRQIACVIEAHFHVVREIAKDGFWINNMLQMTHEVTDDQAYYIPPSRVIAIEALR